MYNGHCQPKPLGLCSATASQSHLHKFLGSLSDPVTHQPFSISLCLCRHGSSRRRSKKKKMHSVHSYAAAPSIHFRHFSRPFSLRKKIPWWYQILHPRSDFVTRWNQIFLISCLLAMFVDPLYFFLPVIGGPACMEIDLSLGVLVTFFRTVADLFYLLHMVMKFRTAFIAPSSKVFGRGEPVTDPRAIAIHYLKSDFLVDFAATLPLPQVNLLEPIKRFGLVFIWILVPNFELLNSV